MQTHDDIFSLIGKTPLIRLKTGIPKDGPKVFVKLESFNATGSVKDRMALYIMKKALKEGKINKGETIIDNTSGNTGVSLAMVASVFGLKAILVAPDKTSQEKIDLMRSYGAEVIVTPTTSDHNDPEGNYMVARALAKKHGYYDVNQYNNQGNIEAHYCLTGPEIWNDTDGKITHFVAGIGTGGTLSGTARFLKEKNPKIKVIAVDPEGSIYATYIREKREIHGSTYQVEGIGSDVITEALLPDMVDEVITVSDADSFHRARLISRTEGISGGGSSGTVAVAIEQVASKLGPESLIVGIFADSGIRYLSKCYNDNWMRQQGYLSPQ
jgi:cystathionine beta-synthase